MHNLTRPQTFNEFVGQANLKRILKIILQACLVKKTLPEHMLFYGQSGLGKTTLAHIVANTLRLPIKVIQGSILEKKSDFLAFFASVQKNDIIFIDEFHGINKNLEEFFYSAMEEKVIDLILGVEGESKVLRMKLPNFLLIGATTEQNKISKPLFDRFGFTYQLELYTVTDIEKIVLKNAKKLHLEIAQPDAYQIAQRSGNNPRIAINYLKLIADFAIVKNRSKIDNAIIQKSLGMLGVFSLGLTRAHVNYLSLFKNNKSHRYFSLDSLANALSENPQNVLVKIEPLLTRLHLIKITSRGRTITTEGGRYLQENSPS